MSENVSRRRVLKVLGSIPVVGPLAFAEAQQAPPQQAPPKTSHEGPTQPARDTKVPQGQPTRRFFTAREMRTVRVLADDIIPRDDRSGSASDAKVAEFIDYHMSVPETTPETRTAMRGGLRWLDTESRTRFGVAYASARESQRHQILEDIAYPDRVKPEFRHGSSFFIRFRDMTASGFFSSMEGFKDLQYQGNTFVAEWKGCPPEALKKLGVSYDLMPSKTQ